MEPTIMDALWSDDRIRGRTRDKLPEMGNALGISEDGWNRMTHDALFRVAKEMRNDYEAERATLTARIAELEAELELSDGMLQQVGTESNMIFDRGAQRLARIKELEAALAQAQAGQVEAIATLKLVYRKHHLEDDRIGWDELSSAVLDTLSNLMGIDELVRWQEGSES